MYKIIKRATRRGLCTSSLTGSNSAAEVRKRFIDYFENEHNHVFIPSSPVLPLTDPTIPFVNAGMFQFKDVFLGYTIPEFSRAVNSQKCIRLKRKTSDLRDIGTDGTHHTFFEMLGSWSFGDYYKKEACLMAWKFLTEACKLPPDRLYVTYFEGNKKLGLEPDTETPEIWAEIGVPRDRILPFGESDNFWQMSNTGPCGPCTEIHYDHVPGSSNASHLVNSKSPLMTELWNLVFMEYNRTEEGFERLERHFVDTGMGLERLVSILQGTISNYETDIFRPLYDIIKRESGHSGYTSSYDGNEMDIAYRTLADHSRMITVALSDDVTPYKNSRLRLVIRRAFNLSRYVFLVKRGLVQELSKWVTEYLSDAYPEVAKNASKIQYLISEEENKFISSEETVKKLQEEFFKNYPKFKGMKIDRNWNITGGYKYLMKTLKTDTNKIDGEVAWKMFDTYGITKDGIRDMAQILGLDFQTNEFDEYMEKVVNDKITVYHKEFKESRIIQSKPVSNLPGIATKTITNLLTYENVEMNSLGECYANDLPVKVVGIIADGNYVNNIEDVGTGTVKELGVIFDQTNFIPYSYGFHGDIGMCRIGESNINITSCKTIRNSIVVHYVSPDSFGNLKSLSVGLEGRLLVDSSHRTDLISNSTGKILLEAELNRNIELLLHSYSLVSEKRLKVFFYAYNRLHLNARDMMLFERGINDLIRKGGRIEREIVNVKEVRGMNDIIIKPGETFINTNIPVCKLTTPDFSVRFHCPFPVFPDISMIENFVITNSGFSNIPAFNWITGITRKSAKEVEDAGQKVLNVWRDLRNFHLSEFKDVENVSKTIDQVESFVSAIKEQVLPLYLRKTLMVEVIEKLSRLRKIVKDESKFDRSIQPLKKR